MQEIFKDIPGFEGLYQVSNTGNIKSLWFGKEKILKLNIIGTGYLALKLCKSNKRKTFKVHQLSAITFLNHDPITSNLVVDHIDNNKLNNRLDNLQLITHRENSSKDRKGYSSKYIGVCWVKKMNKWRAQIQMNGITEYLGHFKDELKASESYQKKLTEIELIK